ncbi:DUF397 domain-containing protein [Streptomyces sp. NPDC058625]|uniref:DUF397 domain-containing protein n=1 Tax=Streptomyces sp. NPDC058625 TaxID=3346564 RepID=UPI003647A77A
MSLHRWRKSTYSPDASNCVEIATTPATILVRDSKDAAGLRLGLSRTTWAAFIVYAKEIGAGSAARRV